MIRELTNDGAYEVVEADHHGFFYLYLGLENPTDMLARARLQVEALAALERELPGTIRDWETLPGTAVRPDDLEFWAGPWIVCIVKARRHRSPEPGINPLELELNLALTKLNASSGECKAIYTILRGLSTLRRSDNSIPQHPTLGYLAGISDERILQFKSCGKATVRVLRTLVERANQWRT